LAGLLDAILDEQVQIVCGNTFVDPVGLMGKAFALAWFFPLPDCGCGLERDALCYSNNLAIQAKTYRAFPFSEVPGTTRSAMRQLTARLAEQGISVYKCKDAQVSHPHPRGFKHFLLRAIVHGRDIYFKTQHGVGRKKNSSILGDALREVWGRYSKGMKRTLHAYRVVGLQPVFVPAAMVIMSAYYIIFTAGIIVSHIAPDPMGKGLRI
jgi:hypothetical protein